MSHVEMIFSKTCKFLVKKLSIYYLSYFSIIYIQLMVKTGLDTIIENDL